MRCTDCNSTSFALAWSICYIISLTVTLFFVMKQKAVGWELLLIQVVVLSSMDLLKVYHFCARHAFYVDSMWMQVLTLGINLGVLVFLWTPYIREFFKVRTVAVLTGLRLAVAGMMAI